MEPPPDEDRDEDEPELLDGALDDRDGALKEREGALDDLDGALKEREGALDDLDGALKERDGALDERDGALKEREGALKEREGVLDDRDGALREDEGARKDGAVVLLDLGTLLNEDPERFTLRGTELELGDGTFVERGETLDLIVGDVRFLEGDAVVFERNSRRFEDCGETFDRIDGEERPFEGAVFIFERNSRRFDDRDEKLPSLAVAADFRIWEGVIAFDISLVREALFWTFVREGKARRALLGVAIDRPL